LGQNDKKGIGGDFANFWKKFNFFSKFLRFLKKIENFYKNSTFWKKVQLFGQKRCQKSKILLPKVRSELLG